MSLVKKISIDEMTGEILQKEGYLAEELIELLDEWHGAKEVWDDELEAKLHTEEAEIRTTNKKSLKWGAKGTKYFSPSSANSCKRELYLKIKGAQRDEQPTQPHQGRWRRVGTAFGDMIQRDIRFIEKHFKNLVGKAPAFVPMYVNVGGKDYPAWEKFAQEIVHVEHRGHTIALLGQPDGILVHRKTGELVGIEIKSKQTTSAQTTPYSMKEPKLDHVRQVTAYSIMFGDKYGVGERPLDNFIILYGNLSKKSWNMDADTYRKNPDIRAFDVHITEEDRVALLDTFADVLDAVKENVPPKLELDKWNFNNYKTACAITLSDEEFEDVKRQCVNVENSNLPDWKKEPYREAYAFIKGVRDDAFKKQD